MLTQKYYFKLFIIIYIVFGVTRIVVVLPSRSNQNDFAHYYISSKIVLQGESPYKIYLKYQYEAYGFAFDEHIYQSTNPPTLVWLFSPLAQLTPSKAFLGWALIQGLSLVAILILLKRLLHNQISIELWWAACALILFSSPVYYNFYYSQVQILLVALVLVAYLLQQSGRHHFALLTITTAGMIKLVPLILVPWFIWRADRRICARVLYAIEAFVIMCGIFYLTGPNLWADFLHYGSGVLKDNIINRSSNYSLPSFIVILANASHGFHFPEDIGSKWLTLSVVAGIAIIILCYLINIISISDQNIQFSVLCISMIVGSVTAWVHYLVFLIFPLSIGFIAILNRKSNILYCIFGFILIILVNAGSESLLFCNNIFVNIIINYIPLYAMLILLALLFKELLLRAEN